jgi:4-hydroxy-tetrahydrodipicolinate reductase
LEKCKEILQCQISKYGDMFVSTRYNVVQVGLGPMGKLITRLLDSRNNINLLGVVDINPQLKGKKLGDILETSVSTGLEIQNSIDSIIASSQVDVAVVATSSSLQNVAVTIEHLISEGINVISICEELSFPYNRYPELSKKLDKLAKENQSTIIGTGINPGFLMDVLPIILTAPCQEVKKIHITRMMNSSKRREPFQRKIGTGLSVDKFRKRIDKKEISGHVGLTESIEMILSALGEQGGIIKEFPPEPVLATTNFKTSYNEQIHKGDVCGLKSEATYTKPETGEIFISMDFIAYAGDHEEFDSVEIEGVPDINQKILGGVHGDLGTAAMVANLIPLAYSFRSGLFTMKDIPVPRNTSRIFKT